MVFPISGSTDLHLPIFTTILYQGSSSYEERTLSILSDYFCLNGRQITLLNNRVVSRNEERPSWTVKIVKFISFLLFLPATFLLFITYSVLLCLHNRRVASLLLISIAGETREITSKEGMERLVNEIIGNVFDQHSQFRFYFPDLSRHPSDYVRQKRAAHDYLLARLNGTKTTCRQEKYYFVVRPKKSREVKHNQVLGTYEILYIYVNGVVDQIEKLTQAPSGADPRRYWTGTRIYPNGVTEKGRFVDFAFFSGVRMEEGKSVLYRRPQILLESSDRSVISVTDIGGKARAIVARHDPHHALGKGVYIPLEGDEGDLFTTCAEVLEGTFLDTKLWDHRFDFSEIVAKFIDLKEFMHFLIEEGWLFAFNRNLLAMLLDMVTEAGISLDLSKVDGKTGKTLLELYICDVWMVRRLLTIDEKLVQDSMIASALQSYAIGSATALFVSLGKQRKVCDEDALFFRIASSSAPLTEEEKEQIKTMLQDRGAEIYRLCNMYSNWSAARFIQEEGFTRTGPVIKRDNPAFLTCNMDGLAMKESIKSFLKELHREGVLLTAAEWIESPRWKYNEELRISHIVGRNYLAEAIERLKLQHIGLPMQRVVIAEGCENLTFGTNRSLEVLVGRESFDKLNIYAETIVADGSRSINKEQLLELLILCRETGFSQLSKKNVILGEDQKLYILDTKFSSLCGQNWHLREQERFRDMIENFCTSLTNRGGFQAVIEQFLEEESVRYAKYQKDSTVAEAIEEQEKVGDAALLASGCHYGCQFTFLTQELIEPLREQPLQ
jgi:hypothetical protein